MTHNRTLVWIAAATFATAGLAACGSDDGSGATTVASTSPAAPATPAPTPAPTPAQTPAPTPAPTAPPTTVRRTTVAPTSPPTTDGGGGMQAGAPSFQSFNVTPTAQCQDGNAEVHMNWSTLNVVDMAIRIGSGDFAETAGYGPNETDVVASIPCSGAGTSSVQIRGCTEDQECAESARQTVEITG